VRFEQNDLLQADIHEQLGGLILRDCDIVVVDSQLLEGIDGVIPMSLFADFLARLDPKAKVLDLGPYPSGSPAADAGYLPARADHSLLFLHTILNLTRISHRLSIDTAQAVRGAAS
jgi:hypothetical protein